jgi:hypothetical protein
VRGNETADELARRGSSSGFMGPEPALGVSRQVLRNKFSHWLGNHNRGVGRTSLIPNDRLGS